jgi:hypothetical protein
MDIPRRTPQNTAIILIDYVTGFANQFTSQPLAENINGGIALAKIALGYQAPLIVTLGLENDPRGGLYPQLSDAIGDHPLVRRGGSFDAFMFPGFAKAVEDTGAKHLVIAGLMTEGCVLYTSLEALRRGYSISIAVDATAGATPVNHNAALSRLTGYGATLTSWMSLASEFQVSYDNLDTVELYMSLFPYSPSYWLNRLTIGGAVEIGRKQA